MREWLIKSIIIAIVLVFSVSFHLLALSDNDWKWQKADIIQLIIELAIGVVVLWVGFRVANAILAAKQANDNFPITLSTGITRQDIKFYVRFFWFLTVPSMVLKGISLIFVIGYFIRRTLALTRFQAEDVACIIIGTLLVISLRYDWLSKKDLFDRAPQSGARK